MRRIVLAICLLAATGCLGKSPTAPEPIDQRLVLAPGETARVAADVDVQFLGVIGDSRCPGDAICILGGDAIVRVSLRRGGAGPELDLHTGNNQPVRHDGIRIELVQLDPYPFSSLGPIRHEDYRATLRVVR